MLSISVCLYGCHISRFLRKQKWVLIGIDDQLGIQVPQTKPLGATPVPGHRVQIKWYWVPWVEKQSLSPHSTPTPVST